MFLFILSAPIATIYTYLQFEKASLRRELKAKIIAGIDASELVILIFSEEEIKSELRWENSKEFEYKGHMYDIVSSEIKGDTVTFTCLWDREETDLNEKLKKLVADAMGQDANRETHENLNDYFQSFFLPSLVDWQSAHSICDEVLTPNKLNSKIFTSVRLSPPTPPPQLS